MAEERFWSKVNKTDGCWLWTASCNKYGYGQFCCNSKIVRAHRYSYQLHKGTIPEGLDVRHSCDNPPCVKPEHLLIGTRQDNMNDKVERNRQSRLNGEQHGRAKLTEDDIREIRILRGFGFTCRELGKMYNIDFSMISYILRGKSWAHI